MALSVLEDDERVYLDEEDYQRIATLLLYYIINMKELCVSNTTSSSPFTSSSENFQFYVQAITNQTPAEDNQFLSYDKTESILQLISQHYHPYNQENPSDLEVRECLLKQFLKSTLSK